jgi:hypothetical protein
MVRHPSLGQAGVNVLRVPGQSANMLAKRTANILDNGDEDTQVHWVCPSYEDCALADAAARLLMFRRPHATTFIYSWATDGLYRFTNTPRLFNPDDAA